jgi:hypothetical protein
MVPVPDGTGYSEKTATMSPFPEMTCVKGTLVVYLPTNEGLVVAADSRVETSDHSLFCDDVFKLIEVARPVRTIAAVTNRLQVFSPTKAQVTFVPIERRPP